MANARRLIEVAKMDVQLQQKEVDRQKSYPAGFASPAEIDQASRALLAATQQLVSIENQLELLRTRRLKLEASERLAAVQLQAAEVNLQRTEIRAPIEGVIVSEDADLNTFVARGTTMVTIEDTSKVEVATNLRMDQLYWVLDQESRSVDPSARGYDLPETPAVIEYELAGRTAVSYRWKGRLLSYDGIGLDPVTRTVPVRVLVDNPTQYLDHEGNSQKVTGATPLVRGMFVKVSLLIEPKSRLVVIPARALQPGNRVLQFMPDESVLDSASAESVETAMTSGPPSPSSDAPTGSAAGSTGSESGDEGKRFDPDLWEPGRVVVRRSVNPVDSLSLGVAERDGMGAGAKRLWVCEVRDPALSAESFVVVSPLGDFDERGLPARAERSGMLDEPANSQTRPNESTVATNRGDLEGA
jgi:hypothetical protein